MRKNNTKLVYSTDSNLQQKIKNDNINIQVDDFPPEQQHLKISLQTKGRRGKKVTLITGFKHDPEKLSNLARELKQFCGTGGTVKNQEIEIQGDKRSQLYEKLKHLGYRV